MDEIVVRQAALDDTVAISALSRAGVGIWQRLDAQGRVETVPYEALTLYERWLHGGPWMSVETGAIQLNHLLGGAGLALVAERRDQLVGYAEGYPGSEPPPFGELVHLGRLAAAGEAPDIQAALVNGVVERARALKARYVTVTRVGHSIGVPVPEDAFGLVPLARYVRRSLTARTGQIFYRATERPDVAAAQMNGWYMPVGRLSSARQEWESHWPRTWDSIPEIRAQGVRRMHFTAAGQEALIAFRRHLYDPRTVEIYCWSAKPLTGQLLTAIRDWTHREGYRTLLMVVPEDTVKTLGTDAEADNYALDVCAVAPLQPHDEPRPEKA